MVRNGIWSVRMLRSWFTIQTVWDAAQVVTARWSSAVIYEWCSSMFVQENKHNCGQCVKNVNHIKNICIFFFFDYLCWYLFILFSSSSSTSYFSFSSSVSFSSPSFPSFPSSPFSLFFLLLFLFPFHLFFFFFHLFPFCLLSFLFFLLLFLLPFNLLFFFFFFPLLPSLLPPPLPLLSPLLPLPLPPGLKTPACSSIKTASPSGLWFWVTSRGPGRRQPTGWDRSVAMETVSPPLVAWLHMMERQKSYYRQLLSCLM